MRVASMILLGALAPVAAAQSAPAPGAAVAQPTPAPSEGGDPRYVIEDVVIAGNRKTEPAIILRELGIARGDLLTGAGGWAEAARLRLLALGYFLDVRLSLGKGQQRGGAVLRVEVEERGTIVVDAVHLGSSEATRFWGGLDVTDTNFLGRGLGIGGGFVQSTDPLVPGSSPGRAFSLRASGPPALAGGLLLAADLLYADGSEFFRRAGDDDSADPSGFAAVRTRRAGAGIGVGTDLSRTTRIWGEGRFEAIEARLPEVRTRSLATGGVRPISFGVQDGSSELGSVGVTVDVDTRSDPVLPTRGGRVVVSLATALPLLGSTYSFAKGVVQASGYLPTVRDHAIGFHALAGAVYGSAPTFQQFFVGDLNLLLPSRAHGINFSTQPSRDFLGTVIERQRYGTYAARALVEYAIPLWRRRGFFYRGNAFIAVGAFALATEDDLRLRQMSAGSSAPIDLTGDVGVRLDTQVGIFTLSVANTLGRLPF